MFRRKKAKEIDTPEQQLADIAGEFIKQNKSASRRRLFITLIVLIYFSSITFIGLKQSNLFDDLVEQDQPFVAEVVLSGTISQGGEIDSDEATKLLKKAFSNQNSKAVILRLNSPGGSPVQSAMIYNNIKRLKKKYNKKIFTVIEDICTSGCYYIASITDEIYADKSSIIGSIGVVMSGFGFNKAIEKIGVERRIYTAGKYKGMLDPFSSENKDIKQHIDNKILKISHQNFINDVKDGRGDRLKISKNIFSGLIWLGVEAKSLGLIDGLGDSYFVANSIIGVKNRIKFEKPKTFIEELTQASFEMFFSKKDFKLQ